MDFSDQVEAIPCPSLTDLRSENIFLMFFFWITECTIYMWSITSIDQEAANTPVDESGEEQSKDTLDKSERLIHKFPYHQDSMKRYKKQLSKNSELIGKDIEEELCDLKSSK